MQRPDAELYINNYDGNQVKSAKSKINAELPSLVVAYREEDPKQAVVWGLRSRRTSHAAEITWWSGHDIQLAQECLKGILYTAVLEGRKRVEVFNERNRFFNVESAPVDTTYKQLETIFKNEGWHPNYTSDFLDVDIFGHVWYFDGIPVPDTNTQYTLIENDKVKFYREKNLELYAKDVDLYREDEKGITFAKRIEDAIQAVRDFPTVTIVDQPGWHGNELKTK